MRRDAQRLSDIVEAAAKVASYVATRTPVDFILDEYFQDAVLRQLTIAGEAASKLSADFRAKHSAIPWKQIVGFRQKIVHDYFGFNLDTAWNIATVGLPELAARLTEILDTDFSTGIE